jgi:hypothetical protein
MNSRISSLALLAAGSFLFIGCDSSTSPSGNRNSLTIVSSRALGPMKPDSTLEFEFMVQFTLNSADSASREVGFNSAATPSVFWMDSRYDSVIHRGSGEFRVVASVHHKVYSAVSPFKGYVNLTPIPTPSTKYQPLASDWKVLLTSD